VGACVFACALTATLSSAGGDRAQQQQQQQQKQGTRTDAVARICQILWFQQRHDADAIHCPAVQWRIVLPNKLQSLRITGNCQIDMLLSSSFLRRVFSRRVKMTIRDVASLYSLKQNWQNAIPYKIDRYEYNTVIIEHVEWVSNSQWKSSGWTELNWTELNLLRQTCSHEKLNRSICNNTDKHTYIHKTKYT